MEMRSSDNRSGADQSPCGLVRVFDVSERVEHVRYVISFSCVDDAIEVELEMGMLFVVL